MGGAILYTFGFLLIPTIAICAGLDPVTAALWTMILSTACMASLDWQAIEGRKYKTGLPRHPALVGLAVALFWIVGFPWYLVARANILSGSCPWHPDYLRECEKRGVEPGVGKP